MKFKKLPPVLLIVVLAVAGMNAQNVKQSAPADLQAGVDSQENLQNTYVRPTQKDRAKRFLSRTIGPPALIGSVVGATFQQIGNDPPEWKKTGKGYIRRFGSSLAQNASEETLTFVLEEAFKLDGRYYQSKKRDFSSRFGNAVLSTFTVRSKNGGRVFGFPKLGGIYTSNIIASEAWYPKRYSYKDGLRNGTQSIAFNVAFNIFREFLGKK